MVISGVAPSFLHSNWIFLIYLCIFYVFKGKKTLNISKMVLFSGATKRWKHAVSIYGPALARMAIVERAGWDLPVRKGLETPTHDDSPRLVSNNLHKKSCPLQTIFSTILSLSMAYSFFGFFEKVCWLSCWFQEHREYKKRSQKK